MPDAIRENDPIQFVLDARQQQRVLCDDLECVADSLGGTVDTSLCLSLIDRIASDLPRLHRDEEALYHILESGSASRDLSSVLVQVEIDHRRFEDSTPEIIEHLMGLCSNGTSYGSESTGYALRCLFDGIRQHQAWEDITMLGYLSRPLEPSEVAQFHAQIARNRRQNGQRFRLVPTR